MVTSNTSTRTQEMGPSDLISAGVAGLTGGVAFALLTVRVAPEQIEKIALLYGMTESPAIGLYVHLVHSFAVGIVYAWVSGFDTIHGLATGVTTGVVVGVTFGLVLWLVAASVVMPLWLGAMTSRSPPVPNFDAVYLAGHVVYGILLGAGYPLILSRMPDAHGRRD